MHSCPRCNKAELRVTAHHDLGSDAYNDDFVFKLFACPLCPLVGAGTYEESRRGSDEAWHHSGYELARADYDRLLADLARCPNDGHKGCRCHIWKAYADPYGSHDPLKGVPVIGTAFSLS